MSRLFGKVVVSVSAVNSFMHYASAYCMPTAVVSDADFKRMNKKCKNVRKQLLPWTVCVQLAREKLGLEKFCPVEEGTALYELSTEIYYTEKYKNVPAQLRLWTVSLAQAKGDYKFAKKIYEAKKQRAKEGEEQRQEHENIEEPEPEKKQEGESQQDVDADPANENEVLAGKEEEKIEDPSQGAQQNANRESKDEAKVTEVGGSDTESTGTPSNMSEENQKDAAPEVDDSDAETTVSSDVLSTPSNTSEANQKEAASSSLKRFRNRNTRRRNKKQKGEWIDGHFVKGRWVYGHWYWQKW